MGGLLCGELWILKIYSASFFLSWCFCSQKPYDLLRIGEEWDRKWRPGPTCLFTQLLNSDLLRCLLVSWRFTSMETIRLIISDEGRLGQGMSSRAYLPSHTAPELWNSAYQYPVSAGTGMTVLTSTCIYVYTCKHRFAVRFTSAAVQFFPLLLFLPKGNLPTCSAFAWIMCAVL